MKISPQIVQLTKLVSALANGDVEEVEKKISQLPVDNENQELNELRNEVLNLARKHLEAKEFILNLSSGALTVEAPRKNRLLDPFKELQANLRHLVWQTREIAKGDYNQHIDFLGDFSNSFSTLVAALKEKKKLEEALRESEEHYRDIFVNSVEGIFQTTLDGKLLSINPTFAHLFGYDSPEEMINSVDNIAEQLYFNPEGRQVLLNKLQSDGFANDLELRFKHRNGSMFWVSSNSRIVRNSDGKILYLEGTFIDITKRKQSEEQIKLSEVRLKRAELASLSGNWELHLDSMVVFTSEGACRVYGIPGDQADYSFIKSVPLTEYRTMLDLAMKKLVEENVPYDVEFKIKAADTGKIKVIHSVALFDKEKRIVFGVIQDITYRKDIEKSLQESQTHLKTLIQTIPDLIWLKSKDGVYLSCNKMFERLYGFPESEIVGKTDYDFVSRELANSFRENDRKAIEAGGPLSNEEWLTFADDGRKAAFDTIKTPMFDLNGALIGVLGVARDITERKQIEQALKESEAKYRSLFSEMNEGFAFHEIVYDENQKAVDYKILNVNSSFEKIIGIEAKDAIGALATKLYNTPEAPYLDLYSQVAQTGGHSMFHTYFQPLDRYFQISVFSPNPGYFATIFTDITVRKLSEIALQESERRFRDMMEHVNLVSAMLDISGNVTFANDYLLRLTGWKQEDVIGKNWFEVFVPIDSPVRQDLFKSIEEETVPQYYENEILTRSGEKRLIHWSNTVLKNSKGKVEGLAGIGVDITDNKKAEEALKQNEANSRELAATKDKFFSIIAHDLKSPFNSIWGLSQLLAEQLKEKNYEGVEEYAELIQNSSELAVNLLKNLLEWARSQTGKMEFSPEYIEMVSLISDTTKLLENSASQKSITIFTELPRNMVVFADRAMLGTVLRNLISNAIKFTKPEGQIVISLLQSTSEITFVVSDNGVGIKPDAIGKLFRIDENHSTLGTKNEKGTGLGLILCKEFIEKHGGKIWAESVFSKGSKFYFTIPRI